MEHEELNLETKIKKRQEELERMEKRLRSLDNVRPQFLEEQDKLEKELQRQYDIYMEKYRTLDYLENELEQYHKAEEERKEEHDRKLKRMREKLLKEEVEVLRGNRRDDADEEYKPPANSAGRGNAGQSGMSSANSGGYVFIKFNFVEHFSDVILGCALQRFEGSCASCNKGLWQHAPRPRQRRRKRRRQRRQCWRESRL